MPPFGAASAGAAALAADAAVGGEVAVGLVGDVDRVEGNVAVPDRAREVRLARDARDDAHAVGAARGEAHAQVVRRELHVHDGVVQGTVAVARFCGAKQRFLRLQDIHDIVEQDTVAVVICGARHRSGGQTLRCSATMLAPARQARQRGARHRGGGESCGATRRCTHSARCARPRSAR